jgi:tetratricopeptide (TPR) repeat protein
VENHKVALQWFRRAERLARQLENNYNLANALHNQAISLSNIDQLQKAVFLSKQAREISEALGRRDIIILSTQGEANHRYQVEDYRGALPLFLRLYTMNKELGNIKAAIVALSNAGVIELNLKRFDIARKYLRKAILLSKSTDTQHWIIPSILNYVTTWEQQEKPKNAIRFLKREILWAEGKENWNLVADLMQSLAGFLISQGATIKSIDKAWIKAVTAADKGENIFKQIELRRQQFAWVLDSQGPSAAIVVLESLMKITVKYKALRRDYVDVLDEVGCCLQRQQKYAEAEEYHRKALDIAKRDLDPPISETLLNNYGELLRITDQSSKAIPYYKQAIAISNSKSDFEGQLLTEHNLALALDAVGQTNKAIQILTRIRDLGRNKKLWAHHVNAWLALANIAWFQNRRKLALNRYEKTIKLCERYQLFDFKLHAVLNEVLLLLEMGRSIAALSLLEPLRERFQDSENCPRLFLSLGQCQMEQGMYKEAINSFERGLRCFQSDYLSDSAVSLQIALAEANLKVGRTRRSRMQIEQVLATDIPPEERASNLIDLLLIVASDEASKSRKGHQTQKLLNEVLRHAELHKQPIWIREAYTSLGDLLWDKDQKTATQFYIAGMMNSLEPEGFDGFLKTGIELVILFHRLGLSKGVQIIKRLQKQTRSWLLKQLSVKEDAGAEPDLLENLHWMMWPFDLALKLIYRPDKGKRATHKEMIQLLEESLPDFAKQNEA